MDGASRALVELNEEILLACIIERGNVIDYYIRPGVPIPNEWRANELAAQTSLMMSMVLKGQDYMGKLKFVHFHMENVDGLHFSLGGSKVLAVMLMPQTITSSLVQTIYDRVKELDATMK